VHAASLGGLHKSSVDFICKCLSVGSFVFLKWRRVLATNITLLEHRVHMRMREDRFGWTKRHGVLCRLVTPQ